MTRITQKGVTPPMSAPKPASRALLFLSENTSGVAQPVFARMLRFSSPSLKGRATTSYGNQKTVHKAAMVFAKKLKA
ncbi:MAG: hypothetical protein RL235_357 [Chlamydiota bacterium]